MSSKRFTFDFSFDCLVIEALLYVTISYHDINDRTLSKGLPHMTAVLMNCFVSTCKLPTLRAKLLESCKIPEKLLKIFPQKVTCKLSKVFGLMRLLKGILKRNMNMGHFSASLLE